MARPGIVVGLVAVVLGFGGCALDYAGLFPPLSAAPNFDLNRYLGKWYEIAKYPVAFENGCFGVTAEYALREDGTVSVLNVCRDADFNEDRRIEGTAQIADPDEPAKLSVSFFLSFSAPYWILEVGPEYEYAVVGEPSRNTLWILSRTPQLAPGVYDAILAKLPDWGYDPARVEIMPQPEL